MQNAVRLQRILPTRAAKQNIQDHPLLVQIAEVLCQLENNRARFNFEVEEDMVDACIYEERALLSRYHHLMAQARREGVTCTPVMHYRARAQYSESVPDTRSAFL